MAIRADELRHFGVEEYLRLYEAEPTALEQTELVDGVILTVSPESWLHAQAVRTVDERLNEVSGGRSQRNGSVRLSDSSLWNPDVFVVRAGFEGSKQYPDASDVELAVEVCLTTERRDLGSKRDVYAREGVPVYWVLMPTSPGWLVVHRRPVNGVYHSIERFDLPDGHLSLDSQILARYTTAT